MAEVTAVKIPPYNFSDHQLWFSTCERTFALGVPKAITDTCTKFNYIVSNLPPEAAAIVRDLIITPDETDPYGAIKAQLIHRTGESSQQEIRKLLTGEELGDRKPSELLRTMNRRASSHNVPKELMLELFLQQLMTSVQTILASITSITVEKAAEVANRILEVSVPNVSLSTNAIASSSENRILQEIERLNRRIDDLTMRQRTPERRNNSRSRNHSRNRSFSLSRESGFVGTTGNFKKWPRDAIHPAAIKKRTQRGVIATTFSQPHISRRIFIKDNSSNIAFVIDTGSDVSVLPASISEKRKGNCIQQLSAANTSPIHVYGKRLLTLDLNLRRVFRWTFLIASISVSIIGADFLYHFNISPDLRNRKLIDNATKLSAICKPVSPEVHSIEVVSGESIFHDVLREFPEIVQPPSFSQEDYLLTLYFCNPNNVSCY
ncbi:transposon Tf2-9 polyprotein [Trichonephila clavata]|uniref:Transposon Tf2-9 polyprotein n=1 Tax=Trichonephila clavata TaxID=2740835 RepID=A0A8X6HKM4_TRICU|nr:transposon Tf2-9 polyprotein [Trichonephila clavata]